MSVCLFVRLSVRLSVLVAGVAVVVFGCLLVSEEACEGLTEEPTLASGAKHITAVVVLVVVAVVVVVVLLSL